MAEAESRASGEMFQRSARLRAFAKAMGDDMSKSTVGFSNPALTGGSDDDEGEELLAEGF